MPTIKAKKPSVPAGSYLARFAGIEDIETKYGEGIRWIFEVVKGQFRGKEISRVTGTEPWTTNAAGKILQSVTNSALEDGKEFEIDDYVDHEYHVMMEETEGGSTRVGSVIKVDDGKE